MALTRSRTTRSQSRSPVPPSPASLRPTQAMRPSFQPPSHYAAAAGLAYPPSPREGVALSGAQRSPQRQFSSPSVQSDSSFEFKPASFSANQQQAPARRKSQLGNLPQLEAQLLPSLRDTIDRMTKPPSSISSVYATTTSASSSSSSSQANIRSVDNSTSVSSSFSAATASSSMSPTRSLRRTLLHPSMGTTQCQMEPFHHRSAPSSPMPNTPPLISPRASAGVRPKSPHTSGLRPPTPKFSVSSTVNTLSKQLKVDSHSTLKSLATLVPAHSATNGTELASPRGGAEPKKAYERTPPRPSPSRTGRMRSRTEPDDTAVNHRQKHTATMYTPRPARHALSPRPPGAQYSPAEHGYRSNTANGYITHGFTRPRRKPGTRLFRCESDGDTSNESDTQEGDMAAAKAVADIQNQSPQKVPFSYVGLGFDLRGNHNVTSDDQDRKGCNLQEQRRNALLRIVSGLETGLGVAAEAVSSTEDESEYYVQEGLAISESGDLPCAPPGVEKVQDREQDIGAVQPERDKIVHEKMDVYRDVTWPGPAEPVDADWWRIRRGRNANKSASARRSVSSGPYPSAIFSGREQLRRNADETQDMLVGSRTAVDQSVQRKSMRCNNHSDVTSVIENSFAAAARERKALGIPPSSSDYFIGGPGNVEDCMARRSLAHTESGLSSLGSLISTEVEEDGEGLSHGAQVLLNSLQAKGQWQQTSESRRSGQGHDVCEPSQNKEKQPNPCHVDHQQPRLSQISRRSSVSVYEDEYPEQPSCAGIAQPDDLLDESATSGEPESSWRSRFSHEEYSTLLERYGVMEMERQECIWRIHATESSFVHRLRSIVELFILPLRHKDQQSWIAGVPNEIARFFDWIEDIVNLHNHVLAVLQHVVTVQHPITCDVAGELRTLVPRLEVYQPYLVRLEQVAILIASLASDNCSHLGEFVRIQEAQINIEGWNLQRLLMNPADRLVEYPTFFQELLALTPSTHPDFLSTISLLHSTDLMVRVMFEVKRREQEYISVKELATRINGWPPYAPLAKRERRLLLEGALTRLDLSGPQEAPYTRQSRFMTPPARFESSAGFKRNSRLFQAITEYDGRRRIASSKSSAVSFSSQESMFPAFSSEFSVTLSSDAGKERRLFDRRYIPPNMPQNRVAMMQGYDDTDAIYAIVFTDLLLLMTPVQHEQPLRLLDAVGVSRILDVRENASDSLSLDLIPVDPSTLGTCAWVETGAPVTTLDLRLSGPYPSNLTKEDATPTSPPPEAWKLSFRECAQSTLRALSFPVHSSLRSTIAGMDFDMQGCVADLLASGLPLPKTPSLQAEEFSAGENQDPKQQEREERGWWSLRFRQVLLEIHRQDIALSRDASS